MPAYCLNNSKFSNNENELLKQRIEQMNSFNSQSLENIELKITELNNSDGN